MNAVVTMAIGDSYTELAKLTLPIIRHYARKIGADLHLIASPSYAPLHPFWEKMQLRHLLERYERAAFIDLDTVIKPNCPDLFDLVPEGVFGALDETKCEGGGAVTLNHRVKYAAEVHAIPYTETGLSYSINSGVMVMDRSHVDCLRMPANAADADYPCPEQTWISLLLRWKKAKFQDIGPLFNCVPFWNQKEWQPCWKLRQASHILHYAGMKKNIALIRAAQDIEREYGEKITCAA